MPIYEYMCDGCAHRFELKQGMKDEPVATCERCGKPVRRLISSPAIMFKGSGWYVTDYSDKLKPPSSGEAAEQSSKEQTPGDKKDGASTAASQTASPTPATPSSTPASSSSTTSGTSTSTSTK